MIRGPQRHLAAVSGGGGSRSRSVDSASNSCTEIVSFSTFQPQLFSHNSQSWFLYVRKRRRKKRLDKFDYWNVVQKLDWMLVLEAVSEIFRFLVRFSNICLKVIRGQIQPLYQKSETTFWKSVVSKLFFGPWTLSSWISKSMCKFCVKVQISTTQFVHLGFSWFSWSLIPWNTVSCYKTWIHTPPTYSKSPELLKTYFKNQTGNLFSMAPKLGKPISFKSKTQMFKFVWT